MQPCIGLFGTCGKSRWREPFINRYEELGIPYFNPQVENWDPALAKVEAHHLANDAIVLFPITSETYATGSLAECGFSIAQAIRLDDRRDIVIMIDSDLDPSLDDAIARKESLRARALVRQHLNKLRLTNIYVVDDLETMLAITETLYAAAELRSQLTQFNPHNRAPAL